MSSNRHFSPEEMAPAFGPYSHAVEVPAGARTLHIAGQVGVERDGTLPPDAAAQTARIFDNIDLILRAAGMGPEDIVKLNFFVVSSDDLPEIRRVRDSRLKEPFPAMSLVLVPKLGRPEWRLEVDGIAARSDI
ncbi:hypothetical protein DK26_06650 [Bosea sp. WAO]|uniref:RidA family protein n=1 Tax=Bosea sp. WAO TaxID=406341 RepID=UPI00074A566B|nr:RidA family protein [Bosea sp. WAO]KUL96474.1 hypothetical protein DK26_06650 [Bosea sp. WAO]